MLLDFPQLVKTFLSALPNDDFPVLDTRLFFSCWLALVMDKSTLSMQDLFKRLNHTGISVDISTFSKACKSRSLSTFGPFKFEVQQHLTELRIPPVVSDNQALFAGGH